MEEVISPVAGERVLELPYGDGRLDLRLADVPAMEVLMPASSTPLPDPVAAVREALGRPLGTPPLRHVVQPGERVTIVANDVTRVTGTDTFLPPLLDELNAAGVPDERITVVLATGTHRGHTPEELVKVCGPDAVRRVTIRDHRCDAKAEVVEVGRTPAGNRVWFNRLVTEADRVILTGEVSYHYFAGYAGGRKGLVPGVAGRETIEFNHALSVHPGAGPGCLDGNPVHEDMLAGARLCRPDFILGVVLDERARFLKVVGGDLEKAHLEACAFVDEVCGVPLSARADLVLAGCGGYPRDINLWQAHKAVEYAARACTPGGTVVLVAECRDGAGFEALEEQARNPRGLKELEHEVRTRFRLQTNKVYRLLRLARDMRIIFVSGLEPDLVRCVGMVPAAALPEALRLAGLEEDPACGAWRVGRPVVALPYAPLTLPLVAGG